MVGLTVSERNHKTMKLRAHAKINLALDVLARDGKYHLIDTVMCEVPDLFDEIEITESDELTVETEGIPQEENLAYKAARLMNVKVHIRIKKSIPIGAGLGGGSSDAAAVLKTLGKNRTTEELLELATQLGMDVPFFIIGGVCRCTHYGEIVEPIATNLKLSPKIRPRVAKQSTRLHASEVNINSSFATRNTKSRDAYSRLDLSKTGKNHDKTEKLILALRTNDLNGVIANLHNDFEQLYELESDWHLAGSGHSQFCMCS